MKLLPVVVAAALTLNSVGCSKQKDLTEEQAKATLQACLSDYQWTVTSVGPIVPKGPNETEVHLAWSGTDMRGPASGKGTAVFMKDQSGSFFLTDVAIGRHTCEKRLPLAVKG